jgi:hemerythrin-like metal-binding protein
MAFREWKNEYNIGVKKFNDDHKELFSYLNQLHQGLTGGFSISDMSFILDGLVKYTVKHFKNEEILMTKYIYPHFEEHKDEHEKLLQQVGEFIEDNKNGKKAFSIELLSFLDNWISNHILQTDMKYKSFFKEIAAQQNSEK